MQPWNDNSYLVRIQNLNEVGDIQFVLPDAHVVETTITGTQTWFDWQASKFSIYYSINLIEWNTDGGTEQIPKP